MDTKDKIFDAIGGFFSLRVGIKRRPFFFCFAAVLMILGVVSENITRSKINTATTLQAADEAVLVHNGTIMLLAAFLYLPLLIKRYVDIDKKPLPVWCWFVSCCILGLMMSCGIDLDKGWGDPWTSVDRLMLTFRLVPAFVGAVSFFGMMGDIRKPSGYYSKDKLPGYKPPKGFL